MVGLLNSHNNYKIITLCTVLFYDQDIRKEIKKKFLNEFQMILRR